MCHDWPDWLRPAPWPCGGAARVKHARCILGLRWYLARCCCKGVAVGSWAVGRVASREFCREWDDVATSALRGVPCRVVIPWLADAATNGSNYKKDTEIYGCCIIYGMHIS